MKHLLVLILVSGIILHAQQRNILTSKYPPAEIQTIISSKSWHPYPTISERGAWNKLPDSFKSNLVKEAEKLLKKEYPPLPATLYLDFVRTGSRQNFEQPYFERRQMLGTLVIAECIEGKGKFLDKIIDGLWLISEESSWIVPAHVGEQQAGRGLPDVQEPLIDLFAAETGNLFAWTYYLLQVPLQKTSPLLCQRITHELQKRIILPASTRDDMWWMHLKPLRTPHSINNWTPWICSNWLSVELLVDQDTIRRTKMISKILNILDQFLNFYPEDGGCDEGPSYWGRAGGSLFDCLEILYDVSGGKISVYDHPLIKNMGRYLASSYINGKYFLNFGDAPAQIEIPGHLVTRYGERINDQDLMGLGIEAEARQNMSVGESQGSLTVQTVRGFTAYGSLTRQLDFLFHPVLVSTRHPNAHLPKDVWLPESEMMVARQQENSNAGFYLAAIGAHNGQSHNHNDVGNFVAFLDGYPLFVDVGVGTYTAKTFSGDRYSIWTMQSAYHNLPTINGVMQKSGTQYRARSVKHQQNDAATMLSLDLAPAYPTDAGVTSWDRTLLLDRSRQQIQISEEYKADSALQSFTLSLMTPGEVVVTGRDSLRIIVKEMSGGKKLTAIVSFDHRQILPIIETITLDDQKLVHAWGEKLYRILFQSQKKVTSDQIRMKITRAGQ